jgi:hypothetical protein
MITEYELPLQPSIGAYRFSSTLMGTSYWFDFRWDTTDDAWFFDIKEIDETPIALGLKLVLGAFIGRHVPHILFRRGVFAAYDTSGDQKEAGFDDAGTRVILKYIPGTDVMRRLSQAAVS